MGKPRTLKTDRDSAFMSIALKIWLDTENVNIQITTSKNGVSDVERLHKTINEKIRGIETGDNPENKLMKMEVILYTYNHKIKHNATGRAPANIFIYAGTPAYNNQIIKEAKIEQLNKK